MLKSAVVLSMCVLAGLVASPAASAQTVFMTDGHVFTGEVSVTPHDLHCNTPDVRRTIALTFIKAIELSGPERLEFELRVRNLHALDPEECYGLGMWLKSKFQHDLAQEFFNKTLIVAPDHEKARRELGFVRNPQGAWEYSPSLHQQMMVDWVGVKSVPFHLAMAQELDRLKLTNQKEQELRRVLQADRTNVIAIDMIRPIVAGYQLKNRYKLPMAGRWYAMSGPESSGHASYAVMMNAWDFLRVDEKGQFSSGPPRELKSYYTFEQPVYACADGEVYQVHGDFPDHPVGVAGVLEESNAVLIKHAGGERSVVGHLEKGSLRVKVGDRVKQGQVLAVLGNSGRSWSPHLHFAIFDDDGVSLPMTFADFFACEGAQRKHVDSGIMELGGIYENSFYTAKAK
jgi:hypothetical protein